MARTFYFLLALYFLQACDGVSTTRTQLIHQTLEQLQKLGKELEGCPQLMAINISTIHLIKGLEDPIIRVSFRLASRLFQRNVTHSKWDKTVLADVQALLHRLHSKCPISGPIPTLAPLQHSMTLAPFQHFRKLEDLLIGEDFSMCAWETVRTQMKITLRRFFRFLRKLPEGKEECLTPPPALQG